MCSKALKKNEKRSIRTIDQYAFLHDRGVCGEIVCVHCLRLKAQFPLVTNGEDAHLLSCNHKAIQGDVTRSPIRNDQFAHFARDTLADQRVSRQIIDC